MALLIFKEYFFISNENMCLDREKAFYALRDPN